MQLVAAGLHTNVNLGSAKGPKSATLKCKDEG
jgi:hypothetical protein